MPLRMSIEASTTRVYGDSSAALGRRRDLRGRRGRAALLVLMVLLGGLFAAVWLWDTGSAAPPGEIGGTQGPERPLEQPSPERVERVSERAAQGELAAEPMIQVGGEFPWKSMERSFDGTGTLSGSVETLPGTEFPASWKLVIEPSRFGSARDQAEGRVIEFDGAQQTFEEFNLPLGGYRVHVEAEGMNCPPQEVLLFRLRDRPDLAGKAHAHLLLVLSPAGFMEGSVRSENGTPLADVAVRLTPPDGVGFLEARSDFVGHWRIDGIRDGRYTLTFGHPDRPLVPAEDLVFTGPMMRHPERVLPPLVELIIEVLDEAGGPLADATLRGFVKPRGAVEAKTDSFGQARIMNAAIGEYSLRVMHDSGREAKSLFRLEAEPASRTIQITAKLRR